MDPYEKHERSAFDAIKWFPPLCARVVMGVVFIISGWNKIHALGRFTQVLTNFGVPSPQIFSPIVAYCELIGGALLLVGLLTRVAVVPLMAIMVVALATAKAAQITSLVALFGMSELGYLVLLAYLFAFGAGALSLDALFSTRLRRPKRRPPAWEREPLRHPPIPPEPTYG